MCYLLLQQWNNGAIRIEVQTSMKYNMHQERLCRSSVMDINNGNNHHEHPSYKASTNVNINGEISGSVNQLSPNPAPKSKPIRASCCMLRAAGTFRNLRLALRGVTIGAFMYDYVVLMWCTFVQSAH